MGALSKHFHMVMIYLIIQYIYECGESVRETCGGSIIRLDRGGVHILDKVVPWLPLSRGNHAMPEVKTPT